MILAVMFKTTSHNCFYLKSASSLLFPNPQASQVPRVHAQTSTSHPHCVQHGSTCWGHPFRERNSRGAGGGDAGIGPVVCGDDSDRELTLLTAWWTSLQCWTLLLASGHISPSPPEYPLQRNWLFARGANWSIFWLCLSCYLFSILAVFPQDKNSLWHKCST